MISLHHHRERLCARLSTDFRSSRRPDCSTTTTTCPLGHFKPTQQSRCGTFTPRKRCRFPTMVSLRPWFFYQHFELGGRRYKTFGLRYGCLTHRGNTKESYTSFMGCGLFGRAGLFGRCEEGIVVVFVLLNPD